MKILKKKLYKRVSIIFLIILLAVIVGGVWLKVKTYSSMEEAKVVMKQDHVVIDGKVIVINPEGEIKANVVFYQGGLVETEAYAVLGQKLAAKGLRVFIPKMPLNLAILNVNAFDGIYKKYGDEKDWYIGGHSLGGASASMYIKKSNKPIKGLFFLGAYPSNSSDLSDQELKVLSIIAEHDHIMNLDNYEKAKDLSPKQTQYISLPGNHSNFGYYGFQKGDGESAIIREEQHELVVDAIVEMMGLN